MSKSDFAPIRVIVESGRLAPASAYDAERINAYANGAVLTLSAWQGRNEALQRKYWAIITKVVKDCKTPWESATECSDALKMAHGVTKIYKSIKMQWHSTPGSLTDLDNAQLTEFFELAMATLSQIVGVDVLTLGREAADTGDRNPNTATPSQAVADEPALSAVLAGSGVTDTPVVGDAATNSQTEAVAGVAEPDTQDGAPDAKVRLVALAKQMLAVLAIPSDDRTMPLMDRLAKACEDEIGEEHKPEIQGLWRLAKRVAEGEMELADVPAFMASKIGVKVEELAE